MSACPKRWSAFAALLLASTGSRAQPEDSMNGFAFSLYRELGKQEQNVFFSPYSLGTALAMTAEGARGDTARQMGDVLGLDAALKRADPQRPYDWSALHVQLGQLAVRLAPKPVPEPLRAQLDSLRVDLDEANATLERAKTYDQAYFELGVKAETIADDINRLQKQIDPTQFRSANALWLEKSFALEAPYLATLQRHYATGGAMPVDFRGDPEAGRRTINDWVATQTNQRILDLLAPQMVDTTTRLVLTNAVYFLGEWLEPFKPERTEQAKFSLAGGGDVAVALMRGWKAEQVKYAAFNADGSPFATPAQIKVGDTDTTGRYPDAGFQLVELPYRGDALAMLVILPLRADGLPAVEAMLDAANLSRWNAALQARAVDVALPKFRLDTGFELSQVLQQLGMTRAFVNPVDPERGAQFDGISASDDPVRRLYIGAVVHKAFVQVDEKGTEAAAATAVSMLAGAAMPTLVDFTPVFRADRPFVFLIREKRSGAVLFLGRLARPQAD
jgi:serine protease inhibitor